MSESWYTFSENDLARIRSDTPLQQIEYHPELNSTNDRALELAQHGSGPFPLLVLARHQTAGRGRGANRWWSTRGGLTFSLLCDVGEYGLSRQAFPQVSLVSALALRAGILNSQPSCQPELKWPNDVCLNGRKVAGLLLEPVAADSRLLVVGAGVNVNGCTAEVPAEIRSLATSLFEATQTKLNLATLLVSIVNQMIRHYRQLASGQLRISPSWRPYCLLDGRMVVLQVGQHQIRGCCRSVDEQGALTIENEDGTHRFFAGTVKYVEDPCSAK